MRFTVPQFIEYETKIVGPFTFRQFIFIGLAGAACFVLYFTASLTVFLIACLVLGGGALALALLKVGGRSLPDFLMSFIRFNISSKIYLWRRIKGPPIKVLKKEVIKEEKKDELPLKIAGNSQLKRLRTKIETKK